MGFNITPPMTPSVSLSSEEMVSIWSFSVPERHGYIAQVIMDKMEGTESRDLCMMRVTGRSDDLYVIGYRN
jgi:hypothetical protein